MSFVLHAKAPNLGRIVDDVNSDSTNGARIDTETDGMNPSRRLSSLWRLRA
jgi:hypothetical protein